MTQKWNLYMKMQAMGKLQWNKSICFHFWLSFRCLLKFSFILLMPVHLMKWGHSLKEQLSGREMREDLSLFLWCCEPAAAFIVHWPTGQQLKNDTLIFCLIQADPIIPVVVLVNMRWLAFKRIQSVKLEQTSPHHQRQQSNSKKEKAMEI